MKDRNKKKYVEKVMRPRLNTMNMIILVNIEKQLSLPQKLSDFLS